MIAVIFDPATGQIHGYTLPANEADYMDGDSIGDYQIIWDRWGTFGGNPTNIEKTHRFDLTLQVFVERDAEPTGAPHTYNWSTYEWEWNGTAFWDLVRRDRDLELGMTDWTQGADSPLSADKKAEWATYRAALRNVPANNSSVTLLNDIVWPTKPS